MARILETTRLATDIKRLVIQAARIARKQQPGQFVIVRVDECGERIPLTIAAADPAAGTITLIVQGIGKTTKWINSLDAGDTLLDVVGPLGKPSEIRHYGSVAVVGGGVGTAIAWPTAAALKKAHNRVIAILGARSKEHVILEQELRHASHEMFVMTDDGSYGEQGLVTTKLQQLLASGRDLDFVLAIGPISMMEAVANVTRARHIRTVASLNPIMVDGTGMCGGCRVVVGGESRFACVDGPEFDAHQVDFTILRQRSQLYRRQEQQSLSEFVARTRDAPNEPCRLEEQFSRSVKACLSQPRTEVRGRPQE